MTDVTQQSKYLGCERIFDLLDPIRGKMVSKSIRELANLPRKIFRFTPTWHDASEPMRFGMELLRDGQKFPFYIANDTIIDGNRRLEAYMAISAMSLDVKVIDLGSLPEHLVQGVVIELALLSKVLTKRQKAETAAIWKCTIPKALRPRVSELATYMGTSKRSIEAAWTNLALGKKERAARLLC